MELNPLAVYFSTKKKKKNNPSSSSSADSTATNPNGNKTFLVNAEHSNILTAAVILRSVSKSSDYFILDNCYF